MYFVRVVVEVEQQIGDELVRVVIGDLVVVIDIDDGNVGVCDQVFMFVGEVECEYWWMFEQLDFVFGVGILLCCEVVYGLQCCGIVDVVKFFEVQDVGVCV